MKLYYYEHCPFCCKVLMAAGYKQLPLQLEIVMEGDTSTPLRLVGRRGLPILQRQDGMHMAESMDIVRYLDELVQPAAFDGKVDPCIEDWCVRAWPIALRLFIPRFTQADFAEIATPESRAAFIARETESFGGLEVLRSQSTEFLADLSPLLVELEGILPAGDPLSVSDLRLFPILRSLTIVDGIGFGANAASYIERVSDLTGVALLFSQAR